MNRSTLIVFLTSLFFLVALDSCDPVEIVTTDTGGNMGDEDTSGEGDFSNSEQPVKDCPKGGQCFTFELAQKDYPEGTWLCTHVPIREGQTCTKMSGDPGTCQEGLCQADPQPASNCRSAKDCLSLLWLVQCRGNWTCVEGTCTESCAPDNCGDGFCDTAAGESAVSCWPDCSKTQPCANDDDCPPNFVCKDEVCMMIEDKCEERLKPDCVNDNPCQTAELMNAPYPQCWTCEEKNVRDKKPCDISPNVPGECLVGECKEILPPLECNVPRDCIDEPWHISSCLGHWGCEEGGCVSVCGDGCGDGECSVNHGESLYTCYPDCEDSQPCAGDWNCPNGWSCVNGICSEGFSCTNITDCIDLEWYIHCLGHWSCTDGTCLEICDFRYCGNSECNVEMGESPQSCPQDCDNRENCQNVPHPDCASPPQCMIVDIIEVPSPECWSCRISPVPGQPPCTMNDGSEGECRRGECTPLPLDNACTYTSDCHYYPWNTECIGHWECLNGSCVSVCEQDTCGDSQCRWDLGESEENCFVDCDMELEGERFCSYNGECQGSAVDCGCYSTPPQGDNSCIPSRPIACNCLVRRCGCPDGSCFDPQAVWLKIHLVTEAGKVVAGADAILLASTSSSGAEREIYRTVADDQGNAELYLTTGYFSISASKPITMIETLHGQESVHITSDRDHDLMIVMTPVY